MKSNFTDKFDDEALIAAVDLVGRTGAKGFEVGYLHDDVPSAEAGWYAHAQYRGVRITAEDHTDPVAAAEALARRLMRGGQCTHCKKSISIGGNGRSRCRWRRVGKSWVRGCATDSEVQS